VAKKLFIFFGFSVLPSLSPLWLSVLKKLATKTRRRKAAQRKPLVHLSVFASSWQKKPGSAIGK
jgi:hypothetical protein